MYMCVCVVVVVVVVVVGGGVEVILHRGAKEWPGREINQGRLGGRRKTS